MDLPLGPARRFNWNYEYLLE